MMKKLQLLAAAMMLFLSVGAHADVIKNSELNLLNPDVRKCLLDASSSEGWDLESVYSDSKDNLIMIFGKDGNKRMYISKK